MTCVQGEVWQDFSYSIMALTAVGTAVGWALLFVLKLGLGFALKRVAHLYVRHYDERHTKSRCELCVPMQALSAVAVLCVFAAPCAAVHGLSDRFGHHSFLACAREGHN